MILVLASMLEELQFIEKCELKKTEVLGPFTYNMYDYKGKEIACSACGTGKVSAALCAQIAITQYKPSFILNMGTSGRVDKSLRMNDVVVSLDVVQHDFDTSAFGYKKGELTELKMVEMPCDPHFIETAKSTLKDFSNIHFGRIVSGDMVVVSEEKIEEIYNEFGGMCCEMEAGGVAQCALMNNIPFGFVKGISDGEEEVENRKGEFWDNLEKVAESTAEVVFKIIEAM